MEQTKIYTAQEMREKASLILIYPEVQEMLRQAADMMDRLAKMDDLVNGVKQ